MRYLLPFILFVAPLAAQTVNVPIQNPSFEHYGATTQGPCGLQAARTPGWNTSIGTGVFIPSLNACQVSLPPDGKAVLLVGNGYSISQDLPAPATQPRGTYRFYFYVANYNFQYAGEYTASLTLSNWRPPETFCSISGFAIGEFVQIPLTCSLRDWPLGSLKITLAADYEPLMFDNVSLTFTPTN